MSEGGYIERLRELSDRYAHEVYRITRSFPREEQYGIVSQLRRSALSVALNIVEGYTRKSEKDFHHFLEIAFGSLKESKYLLEFSFEEKYLQPHEAESALKFAEEIAAMLWGILRTKRA